MNVTKKEKTILLIVGFELQIFGVGGNCSTNCATLFLHHLSDTQGNLFNHPDELKFSKWLKMWLTSSLGKPSKNCRKHDSRKSDHQTNDISAANHQLSSHKKRFSQQLLLRSALAKRVPCHFAERQLTDTNLSYSDSCSTCLEDVCPGQFIVRSNISHCVGQMTFHPLTKGKILSAKRLSTKCLSAKWHCTERKGAK